MGFLDLLYSLQQVKLTVYLVMQEYAMCSVAIGDYIIIGDAEMLR